MLLLLLLIVFYSFIMGGWSGSHLFFNSWLNLNLGLMSLFSLILILLSDNLILYWFSFFVVLFSILFFGSNTILMLFFWFELVSLPIVMMIHYYGNQPEKVSSLFYMFFYTSTFAMGFFYVLLVLDSWSFYSSYLFSFFVFGMFLVKCPLYGFHLWLPKAHVEAPTSASMLLAGVLLKVGLYGFMKTMNLVNNFYFWIFILSLFGYLFSPLFSILSSETKQLAAYSSVSHINLVVSCILLFSCELWSGGYFISLSHGYISSMMFYLVGSMSHKSGTRLIYYFSGFNTGMGGLLGTFSMVLLSNAGVPPNLSFWGELMLISSMLVFETLFQMSVGFYFILSFYYSIFLMLRMLKSDSPSYNTMDMFVPIFLGLIILMIPFIFLF